MKFIYGLIFLCILVFIHELGHFIFAKIFKVKVNSFSIGFGPVLLHKKIGITDYRLSLIPLGGYCSLKGEKDFSFAIENNLKEINAEKDSLYGISSIKRALIAFAGPFFNLLFAFLAFFIINLCSYNYYSYSNKIVLPTDTNQEYFSPAKEAGILTGDIITHINDIQIENFSDLIKEISTRPNENVKITLLRDNDIFEFNVKTSKNEENGNGVIGLAADLSTLQSYTVNGNNFFVAIKNSFFEIINIIKLSFKGLINIFKQNNISNSIAGPARITDLMGSVAKESFTESFKTGIINMLNLMAYISISLFIMNLLPIPILDGGLILFALIECISRKKINPKVMLYTQYVGVGFILILFFIGLFGDISYFKNIKK